MLEVCRWTGRPCLEFAIAKLNEKDAKEFAEKLAEGPRPAEKVAARTLVTGADTTTKWEFDEHHFLVLDLVEPVDMLANLKDTA